MRRNRPDVDPDRRYSIKEFCDKLNICRDTILKYTKLDVIVPIRISSREIYYLGSEILILYEVLTTKKRDND